MNIVIASDLHGSFAAGKQLIQRADAEQAQQIILLGDIYYHGPRNPLPGEYDPMQLSALLNAHKDTIRCVRGNCDSEVDQMISEFRFEDDFTFPYAGKQFYVTHGHKQTPSDYYDVLLFGHLHTGFIESKDGKISANPGSVSLPKNGTPCSYIVLKNGQIQLKTLEGALIKMVDLADFL